MSAFIGPPAKRYSNGVSLPGQWWLAVFVKWTTKLNKKAKRENPVKTLDLNPSPPLTKFLDPRMHCCQKCPFPYACQMILMAILLVFCIPFIQLCLNHQLAFTGGWCINQVRWWQEGHLPARRWKKHSFRTTVADSVNVEALGWNTPLEQQLQIAWM